MVTQRLQLLTHSKASDATAEAFSAVVPPRIALLAKVGTSPRASYQHVAARASTWSMCLHVKHVPARGACDSHSALKARHSATAHRPSSVARQALSSSTLNRYLPLLTITCRYLPLRQALSSTTLTLKLWAVKDAAQLITQAPS